jgi:hypothetical protein
MVVQKLTLIFILCLIQWPALALDLTLGSLTTCSSWLQDRDKLKSYLRTGGEIPTGAQLQGTWLIGFLEGYSWGCLADRTITTGLDTEGVFERADRICRSAPGAKPLLLVALDLVKELDPLHSDVCLR